MAPDWLYGLTARGRLYRRHLRTVRDFTVGVIRERARLIDAEANEPQPEPSTVV